MLNSFYLIWPDILQKSLRVEKKFSLHFPQRVSKEAKFCADVKKIHNSCINKGPQKFSP